MCVTDRQREKYNVSVPAGSSTAKEHYSAVVFREALCVSSYRSLAVSAILYIYPFTLSDYETTPPNVSVLLLILCNAKQSANENNITDGYALLIICEHKHAHVKLHANRMFISPNHRKAEKSE